MKCFSELNTWKVLEAEAKSFNFAQTSSIQNNSNLIFHAENLSVDFSRQRINKKVINLLIELAEECNLTEKIQALIGGEKVNKSENRPALHTALRIFDKNPILVDGKNIIPQIYAAREQIKIISDKIRAGEWLGDAAKPISNIVNIGIGGSDFGPKFCLHALKDFAAKNLNYHFISDADPFSFDNVISSLDPETTLFIISSKSFTTVETLYNARKAINWLKNIKHKENHFIAVTANVNKAKEFGINHIVPIWDWVGGRFSSCSGINLITAIAIGYDNFEQLLLGARNIDRQFYSNDLMENAPVILGLIDIWNNNFLHINNLLYLIYSYKLRYIVPFLQQLEMESNGKSIDLQGRAVNYSTSPIVWGGLGNQGQHSYFQLLCQGTHKIAATFINDLSLNNELINQMCTAQQELLAQGILDVNDNYVPGVMPVTQISLKKCTPAAIGELIALMEHKVYVQGVIWGINSFDQPGVANTKRKINYSFV